MRYTRKQSVPEHEAERRVFEGQEAIFQIYSKQWKKTKEMVKALVYSPRRGRFEVVRGSAVRCWLLIAAPLVQRANIVFAYITLVSCQVGVFFLRRRLTITARPHILQSVMIVLVSREHGTQILSTVLNYTCIIYCRFKRSTSAHRTLASPAREATTHTSARTLEQAAHDTNTSLRSVRRARGLCAPSLRCSRRLAVGKGCRSTVVAAETNTGANCVTTLASHCRIELVNHILRHLLVLALSTCAKQQLFLCKPGGIVLTPVERSGPCVCTSKDTLQSWSE
ncbi:hypothetical protein KCU61_g60, partial [Aureobasidium melanogenum]